jgi:hypothetical protein
VLPANSDLAAIWAAERISPTYLTGECGKADVVTGAPDGEDVGWQQPSLNVANEPSARHLDPGGRR